MGATEIQNYLEVLIDIAYVAGEKGLSENKDSRIVNQVIIKWADDFSNIHKDTDWFEVDYLKTVYQFTENKILIEKDDIEFNKLKEMWTKFGDIPIDEEEDIEEQFYCWNIGTNRYEICYPNKNKIQTFCANDCHVVVSTYKLGFYFLILWFVIHRVLQRIEVHSSIF